jgi:HK97 family phage major capsid protein
MNQLVLPHNVYANKLIECRSMPSLIEQRNNLLESMDQIIKTVKEETRALNDEEQAKFNQQKAEVERINQTLAAEQANELLSKQEQQVAKQPGQEEQRMLAESNFLRFIRGEERALDVAGNGGIIPTEISARIIQRVRELSPIYARATIYNIGGDLVFPSFDYATINVAYVADMAALTPQNGNFTTIKLQNFIAGALVQVSRSLMNRTDFELVGFIVEQMSRSIARFLENQLLNGIGTTAATGIFVDTNATIVTAAGATAVTIDDLITTQLSVVQEYQNDAIWIMNKSLFSSLRKVKDLNNQYLLNQDVTQEFGWSLLGKPVYVSEQAPNTMTTGQKVLAYGSMSGLYVKLAQNVEIQVLNELYSINHATGVVGYVEFDSRIVEPQKISVLRLA